MYGKHFASMYDGSMVGSGAVVFAVMGYVIATYQLDDTVGAQVRLNPDILSVILGERADEVQKAIEFLCSPDPKSTSPDEDGRRLVKLGQFDYRVVNGAKYTKIRNEEERREANRLAKRKQRMNKRPKRAKPNGSGPLPGERSYVLAHESGASEAQLNNLTDPLGDRGECPL